ncbi:MAG: thiamine-phosphate kinase [Oceanospirillaceae bacterium]|nr:thiamine-phosphate kinase [Oceanospirillaceae bacterium]
MDEFALIGRYFAGLCGSDDSIVVGIGDDCAQLRVLPGHDLVVSIDTLVEGTHFLPGTHPEWLASRLLGAAVSDLAAMGAIPAWFTLALTLPEADEAWVGRFASQLGRSARQFGITLVGGDTTRGPLTLSAQVHGWVPAGRGLHRRGAAVGDLVCVTGTLGDSRGGLECQLAPEKGVNDSLLERFFAPQPRLDCGRRIAAHASACIDISDGLLADLGHVLAASEVGARIERRALPLSPALVSYCGETQARDWALCGGEDFELCFTVPVSRWETLQRDLAGGGVPVTRIGEILPATEGLQLADGGKPCPLPGTGYNHFASADDRADKE